MPSLFKRIETATRWFPEGISREERSLVHKLDMLVLPYACLSFFVKYLDVSALSMYYQLLGSMTLTYSYLMIQKPMHTFPE